MEQTIVECHDSCESLFEELIEAMRNPECDFGEQLSLAIIKEEYGRFKVWRGNVSAHHDISRRTSLEYRLRDSKFYRDKIIRHLNDLSTALNSCIQLVRGERLPIDECASPTESSIASTSEFDEDSEEDEGGKDGSSSKVISSSRIPTLPTVPDSFLTLRNLLQHGRNESEAALTVAFGDSERMDAESIVEHGLEPEVVQLRSAITDIMSHLYQLAMLIRRPVPGDRLTRSAKIDVTHFEHFDNGYVRDCFPRAQPWLQKRLAKAITRRRQHLIYNRKHHERLARPRLPTKTHSKVIGAQEEPISFTAPNTVINAAPGMLTRGWQTPLTARLASTRFGTSIATPFTPPKRDAGKDDEQTSEADTHTSYASTLGGKDKICIPPRPKDDDGQEMTEFECPYCFRILEIRSARAWRKHVLTDLTPYVCTFEDCRKADAMFESRSEWDVHELQFHRREWTCGEEGHKTFNRKRDFEEHLRDGHRNTFSEAQLPIFVKSCERAVQSEMIECPLCTEDFVVEGDDKNEPVIRQDTKYIPAKIFKRHLGRHQERLSLFAISSTEEEADDQKSLPSNNLNSGNSRLSWIDSDVSSSSAEDSAPDQKTELMNKLASPPNRSVNDSLAVIPTDELPRELQSPKDISKIQLPCRDVRPHSKNPNFVGRKETFLKIQQVLDPKGSPRTYRKIFALCGSGGVGKTQTALNYVFQEMNKFSVVLWAHASSKDSLVQSFSTFAANLGLVVGKGVEKDPTLDADVLKSWFNETEVHWLLVVDSADNLLEIDDYLPTGRHGSILITSRNASYVPKYGGMMLGTLDEENAVRLLLESIRRQGWRDDGDARTTSAATKVVRRLGYFPLAIIEAAHYIASNGNKALSDFIDDYEQNEIAHTISQPRQESTSDQTQPFKLGVLWNMSFDSLEEDEQNLLNILSFFDPSGIPLELFVAGAQRAHSLHCLDFLTNVQCFRKCKTALTRSSLITQNEHTEQLWMHQLYQESAQSRMNAQIRQNAWNSAFALLEAMFPIADRSKKRRIDLWPEQTRFFSHVQSLAHWYQVYKSTNCPLLADDKFMYLLIQGASFCLMRGFFDPVDSLLDIVDDYCAQNEAGCELLLFESYWIRGGTQLQLNYFTPGLNSYEQSYQVLQQAVKKGLIHCHDDRIAIAYGLMGNGRMAMNDFDGAEEWYLKAFQMWEKLDDDIFKDKQLFISNMAVCHTFQGRFQEAEELLLHSLRTNDKIRGFKLADTLYTLGNVRIGQKDYDKAFSNFKEAYGIFNEELGERHRLTANCCYCLGWLLNRQKKHNSAMTMFEQALNAYEENPYYRNESVRTKYILGTIQLKHGDVETGQANVDSAMEAAQEICPTANVKEWTENDYDCLVMPWSR